MTIAIRRNNNIGKHKQKLGSSFTLIEMRSGAAALNAKYSGISSTECTVPVRLIHCSEPVKTLMIYVHTHTNYT